MEDDLSRGNYRGKSGSERIAKYSRLKCATNRVLRWLTLLFSVYPTSVEVSNLLLRMVPGNCLFGILALDRHLG
jgi:hypothetical protein